jgi:hypothetical protein
MNAGASGKGVRSLQAVHQQIRQQRTMTLRQAESVAEA